MSSGKILLSCRFRLPGYQQRMRTQDGTQEDSKGSSEDEKIKRILEFCQTPKGILEITEIVYEVVNAKAASAENKKSTKTNFTKEKVYPELA